MYNNNILATNMYLGVCVCNTYAFVLPRLSLQLTVCICVLINTCEIQIC